jgi:type II restriction enzyme
VGGPFPATVDEIEREIEGEAEAEGGRALLEHLELCAAIPESYRQDSREEKLYSKYTDALLAVAFRGLGFRCAVLRERGDAADVEVFCEDYSFVADAKAFRLSRTAKNQKDFKVLSLREWKRHREFALLVCPIFQYPSRESQIYEQAIRGGVCMLSYSHLRLLLRGYTLGAIDNPEALLRRTMTATRGMAPTKSAEGYWRRVNAALLCDQKALLDVWRDEKEVEMAALECLKVEALECLERREREIRCMTHEQATAALIHSQKIDNHTQRVRLNQRTSVVDYAEKRCESAAR